MKKTITRTLSAALALMMLLSSCSSGNTAQNVQPSASSPAASAPAASASAPASTTPAAPVQSADSIQDLVYPRLSTRELQTFNILFSQNASDFENLCNMTDPLLEVDTYGALVPGIAESWKTDDGGLTWVFNLRKGVKWVDVNGKEKADCNAQDFATGLEWVLNFHKNDSANTSMPIEMIAGASEYYEWTKTLEAAEAHALNAEEGSKFREMVGFETPDDYTVIYHCITEKPYFDSVATYACLYPLAQGMVDEIGGVENTKAMNNENMWYNGCYTMTTYIHGNEKVYTKNPLYWDTEATLFNTVTYKMVESNDVAFQLYQAGELDYVVLTEGNLKTISGNTSHEFYDYLVPDVASKYSYQFHFNYNKNNEDGTPDTNWNTAIANKAFRQAWYYGVNLVEYFKRTNTITPMVCENNAYTMKGLVYNSAGVEYTELVRQELGMKEPDGVTMARLDAAKAADLKKQAMEELSALGVTFPVYIDHYISGSSQTALDSANVLKQCFKDALGDDFVVLNIKTYVSSLRQEVINPRLHSIAINGWGADYGDPQNYLGQEAYMYDNAYYSTIYSCINSVEETAENADLIAIYKEYTRLVEAADAITTDLDARYAAYAKAEAYMLDNALVVPCYLAVGWALSKIDNTTRLNAMFGCQNDKMKNWVTDANGITTAYSDAARADKAAAIK